MLGAAGVLNRHPDVFMALNVFLNGGPNSNHAPNVAGIAAVRGTPDTCILFYLVDSHHILCAPEYSRL